MKLFLGILLTYILLTVKGEPLELANFENCQIVGEGSDFKLSWTYNDTHIKIQMDAITLGWLAIGLSTDGSMDSVSKGSDIAIGFVKDGVGYVGDYWVKSYTIPDRDQIQDVEYLSGTEENGRTKISFIRKLETGDPQDRPIKIGESTYLIWAIHPEDPNNIPATIFSRHLQRGNTPILWTSSTCDKVPPPPMEPSSDYNHIPLIWKTDDNSFGFGWKILEETIRFQIEANIIGWVGIGFTESPNMLNSDMVVGWINSSGFQNYFDMWSGLERIEPLDDTLLGGTSDITLIFLYYDANTQKTIFQFERPLSTSDIRDLDFVDRNIYVLWAYGYVSDGNEYHMSKHSQSGILSVNFFQNSTNIATDDHHFVRSIDRTIHGVLQIITWMVFVPCAILVSQFFWKDSWEKNWGYVHMTLQILAVVTSTLAIVMMCFLHGISFGNHQIFGFCLVGGLQILAMIGIITKCVEIKNNIPIKLIELFLSFFLLLMGNINLFIGLGKYGFHNQGETTPFPMGAYVSFFVLLALVMLIVGGGILYGNFIQKRDKGIRLIKNNPDDDSVFDNQLFSDSVMKNKSDSDEDTGIQLEDNSIEESSSVYPFPPPPPSNKSKLFYFVTGFVAFVYLSCLIVIITFFFLTPVDKEIPPFKFCPDCEEHTYLYDKFEVPVGWHGGHIFPSTTYACRGFTIDNTKQYHVVEFEPIIDSELVHHMIIFSLPWDASGTYFPCIDMPDSSYPLFTWGVGGEKSTLPYNAGIKIGKNTGIKYLVLQIHYNNPALKNDVLDSSGFKLKMTTKLRENDIGFLMVGTNLGIELPPKMNEYEISGNCTSEWTESLPFPITVYSNTIHAHQLGKAIWTEIWRDGQFVDWVGETALVYDFNKQIPAYLPSPVVVKPGDDLITHCIYDTSKQTNITKGGLSTDNEMCLNIIAYYPKLDASTCLSDVVVIDMNSPSYSKPKSRLYPNMG